MPSRYSHMRMEAKRRALDEIAARQGAADETRREESRAAEVRDGRLMWWGNPLYPNTSEVLRRVAEQTHLHVVVTDGTGQVVTVFEYQNTFGFVGIRAAVDGARVAWRGPGNFAEATDGRYYYYWLSSQTERLQVLGRGSTFMELSTDEINALHVPDLPLAAQLDIANYLDRETERLDALIAAKERLVGLLTEKRRALITCAVTQGLDPTYQLRDSAIPWLGKIPAHWGAIRIAWLFRERDQRGEPDLPLLEVSINAGVVLREFSEEKIESTAADFNIYKVARLGDVVFNKMRMWQGAVGVAPEDGLVSPDYVVAASTGTLSPEYAGLLFRTPVFSAECGRRSHGIVWDRLRLYWEEFRDIAVALPSASEQAAIVSHVTAETRKLDALFR